MLIGIFEEIRNVKGMGEAFGGYFERLILSRGRKQKELKSAIQGMA